MSKKNKLPNDMIAEISRTAIEMWESNKQKEKKKIIDNRLFNTKLLITNYRKLKVHCDTIPDTVEAFEDSMFDEEKLTLETLMKEKVKTYKMLHYVDSMIEGYRAFSTKQGIATERAFKVLERLYIAPNALTATEVCELFNISKSQAYKDRDKAIQDLSIILFGNSVLEFR